MDHHLIYEKLEQRRFDPITNKYHYVLNENITDEKLLARLVHKEEDQHPQIKKKLIEYRQFKELISQEFESQLVRINAEQPKKTVLKNFVQAIEHPF
jgi:adenylate kinase family enzyme